MKKNEENAPIHLSIVIPLHNEEDSVASLVDKILETADQFDFSYEIVLIDDGSTDRTWAIIEGLAGGWIKAIKLRRNFGQTSAMVAGFEHARGEIIVTMDGDLQNDPDDIPRLLKKMAEGYDIVSGWRKNRKDHLSRVFPSIVANHIISATTGVRLHDYGCSLKAYQAKTIKAINAYGEMHRFFPALASMTGARVAEIPVKHHPRRYGISKYGPGRIYKVFSDIFAMNLIIRFSTQPLKGFVYCALPFALLTILFGALSTLAFIHQWTAGKSMFFFIAAALCGVAVIHMIYLGVLGEIFRNWNFRAQAHAPDIEMKEIAVIEDN